MFNCDQLPSRLHLYLPQATLTHTFIHAHTHAQSHVGCYPAAAVSPRRRPADHRPAVRRPQPAPPGQPGAGARDALSLPGGAAGHPAGDPVSAGPPALPVAGWEQPGAGGRHGAGCCDRCVCVCLWACVRFCARLCVCMCLWSCVCVCAARCSVIHLRVCVEFS